MSILIKGMKMPISCWDCPLINTSPCACKGYSTALEHTTNRHPDCPLVPVPPHGRLIDADALMERIDAEWNGRTAFRAATIVEYINDAPTIIPADEALAKDTNVPTTYDLLYEEGGAGPT